jgi:hypothetical protein
LVLIALAGMSLVLLTFPSSRASCILQGNRDTPIRLLRTVGLLGVLWVGLTVCATLQIFRANMSSQAGSSLDTGRHVIAGIVAGLMLSARFYVPRKNRTPDEPR